MTWVSSNNGIFENALKRKECWKILSNFERNNHDIQEELSQLSWSFIVLFHVKHYADI